MQTHPFRSLLADRHIGSLWAGLALSAFGSELSRIGMIWLAIQLAGAWGAAVAVASYVVMLLVGLGAGAFADRLPSRRLLVATDVASALIAILPVILAVVFGLSLWMLIVSAVGLAAMGAIFQPALQASVPLIANGKERVQSVNALLDATSRMARLIGPFLAGLLIPIVPVIHFLTLNAISYLCSAAAIFLVGETLNRPVASGPVPPVTKRIFQGVENVRCAPLARELLIANTIVIGAWIVSVILGFPFLAAEFQGNWLGVSGVSLLAAFAGSYGAGDFVSNLWVAGVAPEHKLRFMYSGYVLFGLGIFALAGSLLWLPANASIPAALAFAFLAGLGGPMFFILMMTHLQTAFGPEALGGVLRLRYTLMAGGMLVGSIVGPIFVGLAGAGATVATAGAVIAMVGFWGYLRPRDDIGSRLSR
jgi:DHA3 family macrolide efflux protein-like MFS transporter